MKGRQLILSLSLLLLGGLCLNTGIQAQAGGGGQISVQILGNLAPGVTNTLILGASNEYTWTDLQNLSEKKHPMFDGFEVNAADGVILFSLASNLDADQASSQAVIAFFENYLNTLLVERQNAGIEKGPVSAAAAPSIGSDAAIAPNSNATAVGVDGSIINVE